ncbi:MAG: ATP-binding protein [Bacteroidota bacterium]
MVYIKREIEKELIFLSKQYPVITIIGPRQSGKTTLAKKVFFEYGYYSLESPDIRSIAQEDPRGFLSTDKKGLILDEIHHSPELVSYIQEIVDNKQNKVQYILTGSSNISVLYRITQSLAGRTAILRLLPLSIKELKKNVARFSTNELLIHGFYPVVHADRREPTRTYRNYYETYLERDVRQLINLKDLRTFQTFIRLCAGRIGNLFNASALAGEVGVSVPTIKSWLSVLEASFVIFLLPPYHENIGKRLTKTPKLYFYDVGLASYLLGIENSNQISRDPLRGALFENMIVAELLKARYNIGKDNNLYFYRDSNGNEVDVLQKNGNELTAIEIKSSGTFNSGFLKNIKYIEKLFGDKLTQQNLIYSGEQKHKIGNCHVIDYLSFFSMKKERFNI